MKRLADARAAQAGDDQADVGRVEILAVIAKHGGNLPPFHRFLTTDGEKPDGTATASSRSRDPSCGRR
jgi:hypothetical protein